MPKLDKIIDYRGDCHHKIKLFSLSANRDFSIKLIGIDKHKLGIWRRYLQRPHRVEYNQDIAFLILDGSNS